ncbi:hypothetical protein ABZ478_37335 [Streptomyces sp. NPDC005706]|uniref:hypothetical protein n=1 Tax=Streptomyces sp. NPDC005706 TaxID=3157169 RepID=UPI0033CBFCA5
MLMLFDASLDGIEDSGNEINQALGLANLAAGDWLVPFRPGQFGPSLGSPRVSAPNGTR